MSFRQALADNPAPSTLGDVALRYEPSMLIGQTRQGPLTWRPTALWVAGLGLIATALPASRAESSWPTLALLSLSAGAFLASALRAAHERRKRGFVVNFSTATLRLDFVTPIAGRPRTLLVPFERVKAVGLMDQADGQQCLTVDFLEGEDVLREALAAFIPAGQLDAANRLLHVLEGAFGLGSIPPDSLYLSTQSPAGPAGFDATPPGSGGLDPER